VRTSRGNWNDVWSNFDQRRKAKAGEAANEAGAGEAEAGEPDMFGEAGVAAE
jgi:ribonucleoside-diphosphate reductase beta chain